MHDQERTVYLLPVFARVDLAFDVAEVAGYMRPPRALTTPPPRLHVRVAVNALDTRIPASSWSKPAEQSVPRLWHLSKPVSDSGRRKARGSALRHALPTTLLLYSVAKLGGRHQLVLHYQFAKGGHPERFAKSSPSKSAFSWPQLCPPPGRNRTAKYLECFFPPATFRPCAAWRSGSRHRAIGPLRRILIRTGAGRNAAVRSRRLPSIKGLPRPVVDGAALPRHSMKCIPAWAVPASWFRLYAPRLAPDSCRLQSARAAAFRSAR